MNSLRAILAVVVTSTATLAVPFWGAKESLPDGTLPEAIKPGQFVWAADEVPSGPIAVIVSLTEQRAYVYRNAVLIGVTSVSTGKPGHRTPTGVFIILQKDKEHRSKTYNDAPMPYTERLTWDGVALHAGGLPGYPSSHGCVHLPSEFARRLFEVSPMGMTVVVADEHSAPRDVAHPGMLSPIDPKSGADDEAQRLAPGEMERWEPEKSPKGPLSIVISSADRRMVVLRNGIEIGRARIEVADPKRPLGTHAFVVVEGGGGSSPKWVAIGVPGHESEDKRPLDPASASRVSLPRQFRVEVGALLTPGATMVVTDGAILPQTTGAQVGVVNADPPAES
jgi:hypothetical protein